MAPIQGGRGITGHGNVGVNHFFDLVRFCGGALTFTDGDEEVDDDLDGALD